MKKQEDRKRKQSQPGKLAKAAGRTLTSYSVGALPILNRTIARARLEEHLREFVIEDKRCKISPVTAILVLLKNYLVSREPIYGISEWAQQQVPELLGLEPCQIAAMNDDRVGRCLDRLFDADCSSLVLAVTRHVIDEFGLELSEFHNDSTTITLTGDYAHASEEGRVRGKSTPVITWGYNKDHRSDLKQLLYNLTVTSDGAVPLAFGIENGNVTDDQTHRSMWDLLCQIVGSEDFVYVADSKLATHENMSYIANRGGTFISVLPRTRSEDKAFRKELLYREVEWVEVKKEMNDKGECTDVVTTTAECSTTSEGFRLLWYRSTRKLGLDRASRAKSIRRAIGGLADLRQRLQSPRTRFTEAAKVEAAVEKCLRECKALDWMRVEIRAEEREKFRQETPGRPGPDTRYRREVATGYDMEFHQDELAIAEAEKQDGVFPLVTNNRELSAQEVLEAYKRQAQIEKRFSQLKSQFDVAPVFLKSVHRLVALLTIYYLALLIQALVEREIRGAMADKGIDSLPLYPEERKCKAPTTRRIIDLFEGVQLHELRTSSNGSPIHFPTELTELQQTVLELLGVPDSEYSWPALRAFDIFGETVSPTRGK